MGTFNLSSRQRATGAAAGLIVLLSTTVASALPLSLYRYENQAQLHCPHEVVVWLDFKKGKYYQRNQKLYGHGSSGSYVCRNEARASAYRRSFLGLR